MCWPVDEMDWFFPETRDEIEKLLLRHEREEEDG
jgi:hypothetical protein